jgi:hypothetical protein
MSSFMGWLLGPREDPEQRERDKGRQRELLGTEHDYIRRNLADLFDLPYDMLCAEEARLDYIVRRGNPEGRVRLAQVRYVRQYREAHEPEAYRFGASSAPVPAAVAPQAAPTINIIVNAVEGGGRVDSANARGGTNDSGQQTEAVVAALMRQLGPLLTQAIGNRQAAPLQISVAEPQRAIASPSRRAVALVRKP